MEFCKRSTDKLVRADGLSDGEDHVPEQPWVAVRRFLKSIVNHPLVSVGLDVFNRWKVVMMIRTQRNKEEGVVGAGRDGLGLAPVPYQSTGGSES